MSQSSFPQLLAAIGWLVGSTLCSLPPVARSQSALPDGNPSVLDSIGGFDKQRVEAVSAWWRRPEDPQTRSEAAKLLFQVNRLGRTSLSAQRWGTTETTTDPLTWRIGDAVAIRGRAQSIAAVRLPPELADVLDFSVLYQIEMETASGRVLRVIATSVPQAWIAAWSESRTLDQPMSAVAMVVSAGGDSEPRIVATPRIAWFPVADPTAETETLAAHWALLAGHGFDVSLIEPLRRLDRQRLVAADQSAFYAMLRAAAEIQPDDAPPPREIDAAELLRNPADAIGMRIRLRCQSVRITRIVLKNPDLIDTIGSDHYWQIDALGDLGNVVIQIESDDPNAEPARFENRYPVSLAILRLPDFLERAMAASASPSVRNDVLMVSQQLLVDGFFYRLWSYENDLMQRHGGGNQFGPLVMASRIVDIEPSREDVVGVGQIGQWAAISAVVMMLAGAAWVVITGRHDARSRAKRQPSEKLEWEHGEFHDESGA